MTGVEGYYVDYAKLKGWDGSLPPEDLDYFDRVASAIDLPPRSDILELGSGDAKFLRWAVSRGHRPTGVELQAELVRRATEQGIRCLQAPLRPGMLDGEAFELIAAFDVLEHLSVPEIESFFAQSAPRLKPGGLFVLRFPNGSSPFGMFHHNSDVTHRTVLSHGVIAQIAHGQGLRVSATLRPRSYPAGSAARLRRWVVYRLQDLTEGFIKGLYFGGRGNLEDNLLVVLNRAN